MNDQSDGINWTDYTWNPVTGCLHGCPYCYARRLSHRLGRSFQPAFHPDRLREPIAVTKPSRVFVCSMADLFGTWVPKAWIDSTIAIAGQVPQHTLQFLTKNPVRLPEFNPWPRNCWVGATVDNRHRLDPTLEALAAVRAPVRFISFEPLLGDLGIPNLTGIVEWIIIGACTGKNASQPAEHWVQGLLAAAADARIPVLFKDNLIWPYRREEFPKHRLVSIPVPSLRLAQAPLPL